MQRRCGAVTGLLGRHRRILDRHPARFPRADLDRDLDRHMLYHHDVADTDAGAAINAERVAELCAADWGLWRTTKVNTERVRNAIPKSGLEPAAQRLMLDRLDRLWQRIDAVPKPRAWRLRDRLGDRKRWYQEPDEVA